MSAQLTPGAERLAGGADGQVDVLLRALDGGGQHLARARVPGVVALPVLGPHPLIVDEVAQLPTVVIQPCLWGRIVVM